MASRADRREPEVRDDFRPEDIQTAIRDHPYEADAALAMIQIGLDRPISAASIRAFAVDADEPVETFYYERLDRKGLVRAFGLALRAEGVQVGPVTRDYSRDHTDPKALARFANSASAFRCRIEVNRTVVGSGCLLGPSTVLTAWHVIAVAAPGSPQEPRPDVRVILADGTRVEAYIPSAYESPCADTEYGPKARLPDSDDLLADRDDIALLHLKRPAALHLGAALLPHEQPSFRSRSIYLVHFPFGEDHGIGNGPIRKIRNFTRRWAHEIESDAGSSGGGCFDVSFRLIGIHQGRWDGHRRLVPLGSCLDQLKAKVTEDMLPTLVWSLNGRMDGQLVIGRDEFFQAVAEIAQGGPAARGLRVKRTDAGGDVTGIPFTRELLQQVLARKPQPDFLVSVSFDTVYEDLPAKILRRARLSGVEVSDALPAVDGVSDRETAPEAVEADRARRTARQIAAAADAAGKAAWIFVEHPSAAFGEKLRYALEAFIDQALRLPGLRVIIAGFEAVALPGTEYQTLDAARRGAAPGFLVEYLRGFSRQDVVNLLDRAVAELRLDAPQGWSEGVADAALQGLETSFNRYSRSDVLTVVERCRAALLTRRSSGGGG